jgi:protein involved in polysaccharide export with SLBB domain
MITKRHKYRLGHGLVRRLLAVGCLLAFVSLVFPAHGQVQRKPKGPTPPSYDEVMQRALSEKKAASNAPVAPPKGPRVVSIETSSVIAPNKPQSVTAEPSTVAQPADAKNPIPPPVTVPSAAPDKFALPPSVELMAKPSSPVVPAPASPAVATSVKSRTSPAVVQVAAPSQSAISSGTIGKQNGPIFSELPPDLRPRPDSGQMVPTAPRAKNPAGANTTNSLTTTKDTLDDKHQLAIGDHLRFRIAEDDEESRVLMVTDSGEIELPNNMGRFAATEKTCKELAKIIKMELEKEYYYKATVNLAVEQMARSRGKVQFAGAVRMPGTQEIPSDEPLTLSNGLLLRGGFTDWADKKHVKLRRIGAGETTVNVQTILESGKSEADPILQPGDRIFVPDVKIRF